MSEKSYVSMEKHICIVCGDEYETNTILMNRRLKDSMEKYTVTGTGLCEEHQKKQDDGYIALVETSTTPDGDNLQLDEAVRTGVVAHIKRDVFGRFFNEEAPDSPMVFVEVGVIEQLRKITGKGY